MPGHAVESPSAELPAYYYHTHFLEFLEFIDQHYRHCLEASHVRFINDFYDLGFPAQCLFARLCNRKGRIFAAKSLRYAEITAVRSALSELSESGFLVPPGPPYFEDILAWQTRDKIYSRLRKQFPGADSDNL